MLADGHSQIRPPLLRLGTVVLLFAFSASLVYAQYQKSTGVAPGLHATGGPAFLISVLNEKHKPLDRQAVVRLKGAGYQTALWKATGVDSVAEFQDLILGQYEIQVSAVGYQSETRSIQLVDVLHATTQEITLHPDPTAIDLSAGEELVPGKARKEIKRVTADLKSGHLKDARKHLSRAAVLAPSSGTVKFLQGYLAVQDNDVEGAKRYLAQAVTIAPRDLQALELLGRLQLRGNEYGAAQSTLKRATAAAPNRALAHSLLGSAYLTRKEFGQRRFPSAFVGNLRCIRKTMRFMDGDEIVQTLAPQTTDNALAVGVGNRSMGWRAPKFFSSSRSSSAERAVVRRNQSDVEKT